MMIKVDGDERVTVQFMEPSRFISIISMIILIINNIIRPVFPELFFMILERIISLYQIFSESNNS